MLLGANMTVLLTAAMMAAMLIVACTTDDEVTSAGKQPAAIQFDTYLSKKQTTRTTYPSETDKHGEMTIEKLKTAGFGVFATHYPTADNNRTSYVMDKSAFKPNFMYNQKVTWSTDPTDHWTYTPVKYWPNDYSAGDVGGGATGSGSNGQLSFFAYAPYSVRQDKDKDENNGIVNIASNTTGINHLTITYRVPSTLHEPGGGNPNYYEITPVTNTSSDMIDLMWAVPLFDQTKQTVDGTVHLVFKHALSKLNIKVQGEFDEVGTSTNAKDGNTKILIESVSLSNIVLPRKAYMKLEPKTLSTQTPDWLFSRKGSSDDGPFETGNYSDTNDLTRSLSITGTTINSALLYTANPSDPADADAANTAFNALPAGVTNSEQNLLNVGYYYLFPPNTNYDSTLDESTNPAPVASGTPITVRIVYYVITYDEKLVLNTPKYFSIVKNDITRTLDTAFTFDAGKEYKLLLKLGMTSVKCEANYTDWNNGDSQTIEISN